MGAKEVRGKNAPEKKFRAGNVEVAVWRNSNKDDKSFYSVSMQKNYKDDSLWKTTASLSKNDVPKALLALQEAYKYMTLNKTSKEIIDEEMQELEEKFSGVDEEYIE